MDDERDIHKLWQAEIANTTPLGRKEPHQPKQPDRTEPYELDYLYDAPNIDGHTSLHYRQKEVSNKLFRQLQSGKLTIIQRFDFHHHTTIMVHNKLNEILNTTQSNDHRCLLMVHGKGHQHAPAVLKGYISHYLTLHPYCRAYCSALPKHGATGSIYVLI